MTKIMNFRYNITTGDFPIDTDYTKNRPDIGKNVGFNKSEGMRRGWELKNDPDVSIFDFMADAKLELNVQTQQYGRTFEDRTHHFRINNPQPGLTGKVHDVTVVGEYGNAVRKRVISF